MLRWPTFDSARDPIGLLAEALPLLWPLTCWVCGAAAAADSAPLACAEHRLAAPGLAGARCGRCARALPEGVRAGLPCRACRVAPPAFVGTLAALDYDDRSAPWVLAFKHGRRPDLARPLARFTAAAPEVRAALAAAGVRAPLLCPVPLHPLRRLERGYDQAALFAEALGEALELPMRRLLRRVRRTAAQGSEGGRAQRRLNVRGAFRLARRPLLLARGLRQRLAGERRARPLAGRVVWLVDDVLTSGATLDACARVLRRAGASEVHALVLARADGRRGASRA